VGWLLLIRISNISEQLPFSIFSLPKNDVLFLSNSVAIDVHSYLAFFRDLQTRFHAPGDFAQAYVIAHEVGHHVQKLTGILQQMDATRGRVSQVESNRTSVSMELQADCYAGVWGHYAGTMNQLESGDIAEALNAATAIGDDRLQNQTQGRVVPDSFTHGSSEQRVRWFKRGMDSGRPKDCDTFSTSVSVR